MNPQLQKAPAQNAPRPVPPAVYFKPQKTRIIKRAIHFVVPTLVLAMAFVRSTAHFLNKRDPSPFTLSLSVLLLGVLYVASDPMVGHMIFSVRIESNHLF